MEIKITKGVIFNEWGIVISTYIADEIAQANGFCFAENFVKEYLDKTLIIDPITLKIK